MQPCVEFTDSLLTVIFSPKTELGTVLHDGVMVSDVPDVSRATENNEFVARDELANGEVLIGSKSIRICPLFSGIAVLKVIFSP